MRTETNPEGAGVGPGTLRNVALVGSYVPRRCGIATFTKDLRDALAVQPGIERTIVLAMDDIPESYAYPNEVAFQIRTFQQRDYATAADMLNINRVDAVFVQHEYGIYGGPDGEFILELIHSLRMPVITTLHTVLTEPTSSQTKVLRSLARYSHRVVVMSHLAEKILPDAYGIAPEKLRYIPHGIPDVPFVDPTFYKDQFGLEGRTVMLTFGLLSPSKGIETAIRALPRIVKERPDLVYLILGATHPHVLKKQGNAYRDSLERLAEQLGVREHVLFHNRFVSLEELCGHIGASDIYVTPYSNKAQIVSGTLAYALGAGKAAVSTPYWYAEEMLAHNHGRLFPFGDHEALADVVIELLSNDLERNALRKNAYLQGRSMVWSAVGREYLQVARDVLEGLRLRPRPAFFPKETRETAIIPEVKLDQLINLTDDTGILQHAIFTTPDRRHGYCTDDNARALIAVLMYHDLYQDPVVLPLAHTYLSFLHHAFNSDARRFRNFMSYDRRWLEDVGSEDAHGRALWGLGIATTLGPTEGIRVLSARLFRESLDIVADFTSPRAWAFAIMGVHAYLREFEGDTNVRRLRKTLAERLLSMFQNNGTEQWPWCEDVVSYVSAKLPHALILSGQWVPNAAMAAQGLKSLDWLLRQQIDERGVTHLIGNDGWLRREGGRANFDQLPVDAMALVEACAEAYRCTQEPVWLKRARQCFDWFLGNNKVEATLYDYHTGGSSDGLHPGEPSMNQGAESTLAWLIALMTMHGLARRALEADLAQRQAAREVAEVHG